MPDFESIVERLPGFCTVVEADGTVRYVTPATERVVGRDEEALLGTCLFEYLHPDDREAVETLIESGRDRDGAGGRGSGGTDDPEGVEFRFRHADGSWVWLAAGECRPDPETGGQVLAAREVTARRELAREVDRYEMILDSIDDGVYAVDPDGTIIYANEAYASLKGVDRETLIGTDIYEWGSDSALAKIRAAREELTEGEADIGTVEYEFSTADGDRIPVEMRFNTVPHPDSGLERAGVIRDVSERKERESALRRKNERLEEFASIVSHDLRNPLNVATGRLELARAECDSDHLDAVASAHERMEALIEDLLTLAREGTAVTETEPVALATAARRAWDAVATEDAALVTETDRVVAADESRLRQLLENLFRNAVEHGSTSPGSQARQDDPAVTVTVGDLADGFFVADDGPGIPPEDRDRVFEPGYSTADEGTGFGLGIVEQVAEAHGWEVALADPDGRGTDADADPDGRETGADADVGARFEFTGVAVEGSP